MTQPTAVVDAHHHFWHPRRMPPEWHEPHRSAIARDYEPTDLAPLLADAGVAATVLIQAAEDRDENLRLVAYADEVAFVAGVVAWLPFDSPARARDELAVLDGHDRVRGVRCLIDRDDADWLVSPETLAVLRELADRGLVWDVVPVTPRQVEHVCAIAEAIPDLRIVADHLARPPIETGGWEPWASHVRSLAALPNIALKVSIGIDLLDGWPRWAAPALHRYVAWAARHFGADRLLLASNWPVVELRRPYPAAWADQVDALRQAGLNETELASACGGTATTWYGLTVR